MVGSKCSHCGASEAVLEGIYEFQCIECGWWGPTADKMIYEPRDPDDFGERQVARRRTDDPDDLPDD